MRTLQQRLAALLPGKACILSGVGHFGALWLIVREHEAMWTSAIRGERGLVVQALCALAAVAAVSWAGLLSFKLPGYLQAAWRDNAPGRLEASADSGTGPEH